jgi:hypothetical protein
LRRIEKEKKQQDLKFKYLSQSGIEQYVYGDVNDIAATNVMNTFLDQLKDRMDKIKEKDTKFKSYAKEQKIRKRRSFKSDSSLAGFFEDE